MGAGRSHLEQVAPAAPERCQPGDKLRQNLAHLGVHGAPIKGMVAEGAMGGWGGGKEGERVTKLSTLRENGRGCTGWGSCQSDVGRHESHQNASPARQNQREDAMQQVAARGYRSTSNECEDDSDFSVLPDLHWPAVDYRR